MIQKYKALFVADVHMSNRLPYSKPTKNGLTNRLEDQLKLWDEIYKTIEKEKIHKLFVLGDLFDKSLVDAVTLTHTVKAIVGCPCDVSILPGNHDANSIRGGRFTVEAFDAMDKNKIEVLNKKNSGFEVELKHGAVEFFSIEFMSIEETREEIRKAILKTRKNNQNILLLHNSIVGSEHMKWICDEGLDPKKDFNGFDLVIAGHFHKQQNFGKNGLYLGAPMQHNFGDVGNKVGYWIIEFDGENVDFEFIENEFSPRFYIEELSDVEEFDKMKTPYTLFKGDYLRLELEATHAEWAKQKTAMQSICENHKDLGINASFIHKPVYHHESRLVGEKSMMKTFSVKESVEKYVDAISVVTKGLDTEKLKSLGQEILDLKIEENGIN